MRSSSSILIVMASLLARRANSLDLLLDIAGGNCHDVGEVDDTFVDGVMPGTQEVMAITTTTQKEDADTVFGFSVFRGGSQQGGDDVEIPVEEEVGADDDLIIRDEHDRRLSSLFRGSSVSTTSSNSNSNVTSTPTSEPTSAPTPLPTSKPTSKPTAKPTSKPTSKSTSKPTDAPQPQFQALFDCPVYRECPGAGDPSHWCAWICGYWTSDSSRERGDGTNSDVEGEGLRMLRRVTRDLQIPDDEVEPLLQPILYTHEDRELMISIEGIVCGWIQRWLDTGFSRCLHGAHVMTCQLSLRS